MDLLSLGGLLGGIGTMVVGGVQLLRLVKSINKGIYNHIAHQEIQLATLSERMKSLEDNLRDIREWIIKRP